MVSMLRPQWLYQKPLSLALVDKNPYVDNWIPIQLYLFKVSPIAIMSHFERITFMSLEVLMGVRTPLSIVEGMADKAVTYVSCKTGFRSLRIANSMNCLIYISNTDMEGGHRLSAVEFNLH